MVRELFGTFVTIRGRPSVQDCVPEFFLPCTSIQTRTRRPHRRGRHTNTNSSPDQTSAREGGAGQGWAGQGRAGQGGAFTIHVSMDQGAGRGGARRSNVITMVDLAPSCSPLTDSDGKSERRAWRQQSTLPPCNTAGANTTPRARPAIHAHSHTHTLTRTHSHTLSHTHSHTHTRVLLIAFESYWLHLHLKLCNVATCFWNFTFFNCLLRLSVPNEISISHSPNLLGRRILHIYIYICI
jgi:hypothetical protein